MAQPWESDPVVEDAEPWAKDPVVGGQKNAEPEIGSTAWRKKQEERKAAADKESSSIVGRAKTAYGAAEAGLSALASPVSYVAGLASGANSLVKLGLGKALGLDNSQAEDPKEAFDRTSQEVAGLFAPATERGKEILEGDTMRQVNNTLTALGPTGPVAINPRVALAPEVGLATRTGLASAVKQAPAAVRNAAAEVAPGLVSNAKEATAQKAAKTAKRAEDAAPKYDLANKAIEAGIDIQPHMLSDNKFVRMAGEAADNAPLAGGGRKARQAKFNQGVLREIDPEATSERITPDVFHDAMEKAGGTIGEIAARTDVPVESFGDLNRVARRETPDVQQVIRAYAEDLAKIAEDNGGVVPGVQLRKLRTEAGSQARRSQGDLRGALYNFTKKLDDALSEHAPQGDMAALLDARRRYAIGTTIEPLVAKSATGDISPGALMQRVTGDAQGKHRMAHGKGGTLGEYARIGQQFLKEQASSGTAERHLIYGIAGDVGRAAKAVGTIIPAAIYNKFGPKVAKRMVEAARKEREQATKPQEFNPSTAQGFEDIPQGAQNARQSPLGDLTPDFETAPGAAGARESGIDPTAGLVPAVGEAGPMSVRPSGYDPRQGSEAPAPQRGAGAEIPAVEGRPDLPDTMLVGRPGEAAGSGLASGDPRILSDVEQTNQAMLDPGAQEAMRRQQQSVVDAQANAERAQPVPAGEATAITPEVVEPGLPPELDPRLADIQRLKAQATSPGAAKALAEVEADLTKKIASERQNQLRMQAAAELRQSAQGTTNPEVAAMLNERAEKIERPAISEFTKLAKKYKIPDAASKAALEQARKLPPEQVGGFLTKFTEGLRKREVIEADIEAKDLAPLTAEPQKIAEDKPAPKAKPTKPPGWWAKARMAFNPETDTVLQALAKMGGLRRDKATAKFGLVPEELKQTVMAGNMKSYPFRKNGMDIDIAAERLQEAGYFTGVSPEDLVTHLEEAIYGELGGSPTHTVVGQMRNAEKAWRDEAEHQMSQEAHARHDALAREANLTKDEFYALADDDIDLHAKSNMAAEDFMRSMGLTEEEIAIELEKRREP